jgi:integrase
VPRLLHDTVLDTATARSRLKPRGEPYWRRISARCHLGYRRNSKGGGAWVGRFYDGGRYVKGVLGTADDQLPADGVEVLDFSQAQEKARKWFAEQERRSAGVELHDPAPYTVARCMADYLDWYGAHRKAIKETRYTVEAHILSTWGRRLVSELSTPAIRRWHQKLAERPRRIRSRKGVAYEKGETRTRDDERKRKATANRILGVFKAGLNFAFREGRVASDEAWRRVRPFKGVDAPKIRFLELDEARRLLNACPADFRLMAEAALLTGCRYGELVELRVGDYIAASRAVHIAESKSSKARHVFLTDEGTQFFEAHTAGRMPGARLFHRADGEPWGDNHQKRRMEKACRVARIEPRVSFHILRHTYASLYLMAGGSLPGLAQQLGHADTRMTILHYGHLAEDWRAEEARKFAPRFHGGTRSTSTVVDLRHRVGQLGNE